MMCRFDIATPHCARPQPGSFADTSWNVVAAFTYANECSKATARSNVGWSWGLQEVVKWTCPNFSDDS